jgi:valyl-tRNA synthetase
MINAFPKQNIEWNNLKIEKNIKLLEIVHKIRATKSDYNLQKNQKYFYKNFKKIIFRII